MKPTIGDPYIWVDGRRFDFSDPAFIRARCRCGEIVDFCVLYTGERPPDRLLDCPACGYRAPPIGAGDVFVLALENVAGFGPDPDTREIVWIEWKKVRNRPGTGIGGRSKPREVVPPKVARARRCRSCANCSHEPADRDLPTPDSGDPGECPEFADVLAAYHEAQRIGIAYLSRHAWIGGAGALALAEIDPAIEGIVARLEAMS